MKLKSTVPEPLATSLALPAVALFQNCVEPPSLITVALPAVLSSRNATNEPLSLVIVAMPALLSVWK